MVGDEPDGCRAGDTGDDGGSCLPVKEAPRLLLEGGHGDVAADPRPSSEPGGDWPLELTCGGGVDGDQVGWLRMNMSQLATFSRELTDRKAATRIMTCGGGEAS